VRHACHELTRARAGAADQRARTRRPRGQADRKGVRCKIRLTHWTLKRPTGSAKYASRRADRRSEMCPSMASRRIRRTWRRSRLCRRRTAEATLRASIMSASAIECIGSRDAGAKGDQTRRKLLQVRGTRQAGVRVLRGASALRRKLQGIIVSVVASTIAVAGTPYVPRDEKGCSAGTAWLLRRAGRMSRGYAPKKATAPQTGQTWR
jgi:hypothetical protein